MALDRTVKPGGPLNPDWVAMRALRDEWEVLHAADPSDELAAMVARYATESLAMADPANHQDWFLAMRLRHITTRINQRGASQPITEGQPQ